LRPNPQKSPELALLYGGKLVIVVQPAGHVAGVEDLLRSSHEFRECHAGSCIRLSVEFEMSRWWRGHDEREGTGVRKREPRRPLPREIVADEGVAAGGIVP
jgi:hypothetical protein